MLLEQINTDLKEAMKAKNTQKLGLLRVLKSELQRKEQGAKGKVELQDSDVIKSIKTMIDGIKESKGSQDDINILEEYMPKTLTEAEILTIVDTLIESVGATNMKQMGQVMKEFTSKYAGQADGSFVSKIVREKLS